MKISRKVIHSSLSSFRGGVEKDLAVVIHSSLSSFRGGVEKDLAVDKPQQSRQMVLHFLKEQRFRRDRFGVVFKRSFQSTFDLSDVVL